MAIEARSVGIYIKLVGRKKKRMKYLYQSLRPGPEYFLRSKMQKRAGWLARKNQMLAIFVPKVAVS
jgi:hypothetical protein